MVVKMISCKCINTGEDKFLHTIGSERELIRGEVGDIAILMYTDGSCRRRSTTRVVKREEKGNTIKLYTKNTVYELELLR